MKIAYVMVVLTKDERTRDAFYCGFSSIVEDCGEECVDIFIKDYHGSPRRKTVTLKLSGEVLSMIGIYTNDAQMITNCIEEAMEKRHSGLWYEVLKGEWIHDNDNHCV